MNGNWFYTTEYVDFGSGERVTSRSPPDNFTRCIIT